MKTLSRWTRLIFIALTASPSLAEMRYVWKENPGVPTSPYTNGWASAATTIQDAVDVSADGDTVLVANGVYDGGGRIAPGDVTLRTRLVVTNAVTVASVNGPETTLIVGQPHSVMTYDGLGDNAIRGAYLANGAVLSGFTVTNGFTRQTTSIVADDYCGGGIRCESDEATVTNCVIIGNMAAMRGGGIFQGTVVDCRIASNTVHTSNSNAGGGGIYGAAARTSLIEKNRTLGTSTDGGGTYGCTLDRCMLRGNSAGRHGGGAYLSTAVSCTIESNSATQQGGGACTSPAVTNSLIRWNTAGRHGGGLYKGTVTDSVIASNTVTSTSYYGGGYYGDNAAADRLVHCRIVGNSVITSGGGVYNAVLSNCVVMANRALGMSATTGNGGGYYTSSPTGYQVVNTFFLDNEANYQGGAAYQGNFFGCVFSGNRASQGGGFFGSTSYVLYNCSVMGNSATNKFGGTCSGIISNSIVYANEAPTSPNYSGGNFRHSCSAPLPSGVGNTNVNPLVSGYRDPHLLPGSPLIGRGAVAPWMTDATDLDGDARISDGRVDMGADQFTGTALEGPLEVTVTAATNICAAGWPHTFFAETAGKVTRLSWSFGDGVTAENVNPANHAFAEPGTYTVRATVSNDTHTAAGTYEVTVIDPVVYVSVSPAGGHIPPFNCWEKAATNLQDAVDAVSLPGGRVLATNGVYALGGRAAAGQTVTNRLLLDKAVRVESVNGPEATVIVGRWHSEETPLGTSAIRGVYVGNEAVLCGFTVSNGATAAAGNSDNGRGGGLFLAAGGVASNCVVTGCRAWSGGGAASGTGAAGELRDCTVTDNAALTASYSSGLGGGASGLNMVGCRIVSNTAYQGGGAYDCTLDDCEVIRNIADYQGGGAYYGKLSRCRVRDNVAGTPSSGAGGGLFDATLYSCLVAGNTARQGGGVYGSSGTKGMFNGTVIGNTATATGTTQGGGGVYCNGTAYPVRNGIVYYNTSGGLGPNLYQGTVTHTCSQPLPSGEGNTNAAPMLADIENGRLLPGSPCAGAGLYEGWMADALDLEGEPRANEGKVDMGADQLAEAGLTGALAVMIDGAGWPYFPGETYTFRARIEGHPATVRWDFGDDTSESQTPEVNHAWTEGDYVLRVTVSNATHSAEATLTVNVAPDTRYVSPSGSHTPPFRSWADAATNLQDAADGIMAGGRIRVAAGVYAAGGRVANGLSLINRLSVTNGVAVTAVDGPGATFIVGSDSASPVTNGLGDGAVRGVYLAGGASLSGFTVTGGRTRWTTTATEGDYAGGGVYCADETCVVSGCVVTACAAASRGGGIYRGRVLDTHVESNGVYSSGTSLGWGGGICYASLVSNCVVRANESQSSGGGVYQGLLIDSIVDGNRITGSGSGAGYYGGSTSHTVLRCAIMNNNGASYGGGVYYASVYDTLITNNAANDGGGYAMPLAVTPMCPLYRCRLAGNRASSQGGGAYCGTLYSCVVSANTADVRGGGTYYATLENSSVVANTAPSAGGTYGGTAYYSVIRYNQADSASEYASTVSYRCCTTPYSVSFTYDLVEASPQLTGKTDPHLLAGSPCVNGGDFKSWMTGTEGRDMDGEARYFESTSDIGADERHAESASGLLSAKISADYATFGPDYAPEFWAEIVGRVGELTWDFDDGSGLVNQNPVRHAFPDVGVYTVRVTASNLTHSVCATQIVTVVGGTVYASTEGNHTPPFASWETAATNLQDAVNAAVWGGTVWVAGGTYRRGGQAAEGFTQTNRVCIEKPITVRGANGASPVVIEGAWHEPGVTAAGSAAVRGVYLGHKQARLIDVTVAGGATGTDEDDGGGIYCADGAAGGSNCVVTACVANDEGGGVWGGSWSGCIFSDNKAGYGGGCSSAILSETCIVGGNTADSYGGGAYRCELTGCTVTGNTCLYGDGGGLYDSPATRCVIRDNVAHDDGGGAYGESVICSLVSGNTAGYAGGVSESSVELCTVVDNTATEYGGGVGWCTVINSIIWGNHAPAETNTAYSDFRYSQTIPLPEGEYDRGGNCDADPLFVDATAGNYRLQAESPCLNTGTNDAYSADASSQDLDGQARVIGVSVDRGAYEYATAAGFAARGTPIDWLDGYYAGPDWNAAELDDSDGDGFPAWEEYITATDPTDGASCFVIVSATVSATGGFSLSFDTATGRIYTVQHSVCLTPASWANAAEPITGTGHRQTVVLPDEGNAFFYRVRVALP